MPDREGARRRRIGARVPHHRGVAERGDGSRMTVHLVKGNDPILRDEAVSTLVAELLGDDDRAFALEEFTIPADARSDAEDESEEEESWGTPFGAALNAASTAPMMTSKRVVV